MASATRPNPDTHTPFWRNEKILALLVQIIFVLVVVVVFWFLISNMQARLLATKGTTGLRFNFLSTAAGFQIGEGLAFTPQESYGRAFVVGMFNTLKVALIGILLATALGLLAGIARLSSNWLVSRLAGLYIEIIRSTPLLVQLFFWYFGVILALPDIDTPQEIPGLAVLTNRGIFLSALHLSATGAPWLWWLVGGLVAAIVAGLIRRAQLRRDGRVGSGAGVGFLLFVLVAATGYLITTFTATLPNNTAYELNRGDRGVLFLDANGDGIFNKGQEQPLQHVKVTLLDAGGSALGTARTSSEGAYRFYDLPEGSEGATLQWEVPSLVVIDRPVRQGFNFAGGSSMTPEFAGLLLGLVIYTGAFIAEIVRAGINAVPKGQWEASRALGLSRPTILRLVVLPQALRVIIPPLTNQYLNLTKNSSLAVAIGYPDLFNVAITILNQTGAEVQMFLMIMAGYLSFSLITSLFMNWYNKRIAFVER
ncbi:MAG: ABC transporter permease subunit [Caldilineaceae bacterium]|nr:ABC transporter permease subunit [Caldilineaceae bacterium]